MQKQENVWPVITEYPSNPVKTIPSKLIITMWTSITISFGMVDTVRADSWYVEPYLDMSLNYTDNVHLAQNGKKEASWFVASPVIIFEHQTGQAKNKLNARFDFKRYEKNKELETDDQTVKLSSNFTTERSQYVLDLSYVRDSTLTSEVEADESGRINERREKYVASPSWMYAMTEKDSIQFSYSGTAVEYGEKVTEYQDYEYHAISSSVHYQWTRRSKFTLVAHGSRYESDGEEVNIDNLGPVNDVRSDTYGMQIGTDYEFSTTLAGSLLVGQRKTTRSTVSRDWDWLRGEERKLVQDDITETGDLYKLKLSNKWERTTLEFSADRTVTPSSDGRLNESDQVNLTINHRVTELATVSLAVYGLRQKNLIKEQDRQTGREYYQIRPAYNWRISRHFWGTLSYLYRWQKWNDDENYAESSMVKITFVYKMPKYGPSR